MAPDSRSRTTSRVSKISSFRPTAPGSSLLSNPGLALAAAAGALGSLDTALNVAFPDLVESFGITVGDLQWVVVSYVLAYGGLLLAVGQLADRIGHLRMLNLGAAGTVVAMVACATAPGFGFLLAARTFQGLVTAMVMAAAPALATVAAIHRVPAQESTDDRATLGPGLPGRDRLGKGQGRARGVGTFQAAAGFGAAAGPLIGGPLVLAWGWPSVFWFRIPICLAILALARSIGVAGRPTRSASTSTSTSTVTLTPTPTPTVTPTPIPASTPAATSAVLPAPTPGTDVGGAALVTVALTTLLLGLNSGRALGLGSPLPWTAILFAGLVGTWYVKRSRSHPAPLIDPALFTDRRFAVANLLSVLANGAMFVSWLLVPTLLVSELRYPAVLGGVALAASPIAMGVMSTLAGRWSDGAARRRLVVLGLGLEAAGLAWLTAGGGRIGIVGVTAAMALVGTGLGLFAVPNMAMVMERLADSRQGTAGALALTTRTTGIVAGVSGSAALFDVLEPSRGFLDAYRLTTMTSAAVAAGATLAALIDYWATNRARPAAA